MNWQAAESIPLVVMAIIEGVTICLALRERRAKKNAEAELKLIQRRGNAPFLRPSDEIVGIIYASTDTGGVQILPPSHPAVLHSGRNAVQLQDGDPVVFVIENAGESPRALVVKLNDEIISLDREPDVEGAHGLQFLVYPYHRAEHGTEQRLSITFETRSGLQDTHHYLIRHGCRFLQRVEPPLPQ